MLAKADIDLVPSTITGFEIEIKQLVFNAMQRKLTGPAADEKKKHTRLEITAKCATGGIWRKSRYKRWIWAYNRVKIFFDTPNIEICKIKDSFKLSEESESGKTNYKLEVDRFSLEVLRKNVPITLHNFNQIISLP